MTVERVETPNRLTRSAGERTGRRTGWRLSPVQRKAVMLLHIVCGVGWMGADIVLFILLYTGLTTDDGATAAACYEAVSIFIPIAVPPLALGMLATGLLLGWGTKWGLLRYWWVVVKLALAVIMVVLVFVSLVPGANELSGTDATMTADEVRDAIGGATSQIMFPPVVSFLMLGTAAFLSIFKPWRLTPWTSSSRRQERS